MMTVKIGISGWRYEPWRGVFYPKDLIQKKELWFASRQVTSIEINGTFYATQSPNSYKSWYEEAPKDFIFSLKGPRYITHIRRLREVREPLANFFASGVLHLQEKLGPFLWQLPPSFRFEENLIEEFFRSLPFNTQEAARLAQESEWTSDFPESAEKSRRPLRHAMEVRHHSFENPDFISLLRKYNVALVFADTAGKWPYMEDITSDFLYLRLHGDEELYASGYDDSTLRWWSDRVRAWSLGRSPSDALVISEEPSVERPRDVFVYFDNDFKVRAPQDAQTLIKMLS
ncbi:MAG TPA: DUF72 domain-containing protein [Bdellovibrio sp.]|nr:DUF72 domain-containing protein [Bdellovibrio sp.]